MFGDVAFAGGSANYPLTRGGPVPGDRPATMLTGRLTELSRETANLEQTVEALYSRFEHLLPEGARAEPIRDDPRTSPPKQVVSETTMTLDTLLGRNQRIISRIQHLLDVVEV